MSKSSLRFPEQTIITNVRRAIAIARERVSELSRFGITNAWLDTAEEKVNFAESLPDENAEKLFLKNLTYAKDLKVAECFDWSHDLKHRIKMGFGRSSFEYRNFPSKLLTEAAKSENKMLPLMETMIKIAEKHATILEPFGQTSDELSKGTTLLQELRDADSTQELQKTSKKKATEVRHEKFEGLIDITNIINETGRIVYRDNPAELVLFESPWNYSHRQNNKVFKDEIAPDNTVTVAEELDPEMEIIIENTGRTDLEFYSGVYKDETPSIVLNEGNETIIKLTDIGDGNNINVKNLSPDTKGSYRVEF